MLRLSLVFLILSSAKLVLEEFHDYFKSPQKQNDQLKVGNKAVILTPVKTF